MKRLFNILTISMPLLFCGCGDFLEVEPQNIITIDKFWNEQSDVEAILGGCYNRMAGYEVMSRMMIWGEFRSENIFIYGSNIPKDVNLERVLKENITASNAYTSWTGFYDIINRCNIVIKYAPTVAEKDPSYDEGEVKAHIAEATALRSLAYFYLIRTFENVPYSEEAFTDDDQKLDLGQTSFDEILSHLITSLEEVKENAVTKYPVAQNAANIYNSSRVTKYAIYAMLCDMYLWQGNYDQCIKYADLVIKAKKEQMEEDYPDADFSLTHDYPLLKAAYSGSGNVYGNAFSSIFMEGNSYESILEIYFNKTGNRESTASNAAVGDIYGSGFLHRVRPSEYIRTDVTTKTFSVFANEYDGRNYENFQYDSDGPESINKYRTYGSMNLMYSSSPTDIYKYTSSLGWGTIYPTGKDDISYNKSNFILYRLTDIMLLKAEALTQKMSDAEPISGEDLKLRDEAFELVDAVNRRSLYVSYTDNKFEEKVLNISNYATKNLITNLVYDERNRELMFEGKRYYDLVRRSRRDGNTKYLVDHVQNRDASISSIISNLMKKMDAIYWPINLDEMKANKNLVQNSAFGSGLNSSYENSSKN